MKARAIGIETLSGTHRVPVGELHTHPHGGGVFTYDPAWIARPGAYAIAPSVPLHARPQHLAAPRGRLPQAFLDSAPDRWGRGIIERASRRAGKPAPDETDYLLAVSDRLRMGALRYTENGEICASDSRVPATLELPLLESATRRTERHAETDGDIAALLGAGSSLGGARPKATVLDGEGHTMLAKFTSTKDDIDTVAWEKVCLDIAQRSGIAVPRSRLLRIAGRPVLLLDRFDRAYTAAGDELRIPYMSAMTLLDASDGALSSMVSIAEELQPLAGSAAPQQLHELYSRAALNLMVGNTDNHLRNHGLLRTGDHWELSPVFDVTPATAKADYAVSIDDLGDDTLETLLDVSEFFALDRAEALARLAQITDAVDQWRGLARAAGIPAGQDRRVERGFNGRPRSEARTLLGPTPTVLDLAPPAPAQRPTCTVCGRPLHSAESIARGMGPNCAKHA